MVGKKNKKRTPSQRGSPIQEVSSPRRTESSPSRRSLRQTNSPQSGNSSPRRTESSPSRRSPRQTNSPQSDNKGNFGKINVSPNDQSCDSQADHDVASDSVVPGLVADDNDNVEV